LGWGFGLAGVLCCSELQFYFTQDIFGDIGLKPTAASKQKSKKAAAENTPVNVVRDRIIAVLISVFTVLLGFV
jgi:POT family proton-dependent oligopeptide transporter